ncbi:transposase [[Clostridium] colinum]|uniref:transposase n=1 Tax=[Clostridium] colinum TaxID=36835 RepID=UPI0038CD3EFE
MINLFKNWIHYATSYIILKFNHYSKTFSNFYNEIINYFHFSYTNSFTEGYNNKIKILKCNAYFNFNYFINYIVHMFN